MKLNKYVGLLFGIAILSGSANAAFTINGQYGVAFNPDGTTPVASGTLWALIVDTDDNNVLAGMALNSSLAQLGSNSTGLASINSTFGGKTIAIGANFGLDTVFALGGFNPLALSVPGSASTASPGLNLGQNGLQTGLDYGFFFFPGVTFVPGTTSYTVGSSVGGVNRTTADAGAGSAGMLIPNNGATVFQGSSTNAGGDLGGSTPNASFAAVNLIPEPSVVFLGAVSVLGFLRRRRN